MSGHVNMMDDVLISQLPTPLLRSALRALISTGANAQKTFVEHVRARLRESAPEFTPPADLFRDPNAFLATTRCLFSSKMVQDSLPYLTHFVTSIPAAGVRWSNSDGMEHTLEKAAGDVVQAIQALKESRPSATPALRTLLLNLRAALISCETYCSTERLPYPFGRARLQVEDGFRLLFPDSITPKSISASSESEPPFPSTSKCILPLPSPVADSSALEHVQLGALRVPRLFSGLWQMSSPAWGAASSDKVDAALAELVGAGLVATDMADHYGDAELIYGSFRNRLPESVRGSVVAATKWCVFAPFGEPVTHQLVMNAVLERTRRLGGRVELLQFHWYDYDNKEYLVILEELVGITKSHPHLVTAIGLCNFDAEHTQEACDYLIARTGQVGIVSNQVQYSLIDSRPKIKMAAVCEKYGVKLLTYGTFCGGFLSEKWLGAKAPDVYNESIGLTPSQRKYFDMINTWGSWADLQALLSVLHSVAQKHSVDISNVAARWVLDNAEVGSVIVGTRLGVSSNVGSNLKTVGVKGGNGDWWRLDEEDVRRIDEVALGDHLAAVYERMGDCGKEYRHH